MKKYLMLLAIAIPLMIASPAQAQFNADGWSQTRNYMPPPGYHDKPSDPSDFFNEKYAGSNSELKGDELLNKTFERHLWKFGFMFFIAVLGALAKDK